MARDQNDSPFPLPPSSYLSTHAHKRTRTRTRTHTHTQCEACCANAPWMFVKSLLQETTALGVQLEASRCAHVNMTSLLLSSPTSTSLSRLNASSSTDPTASSPSAATGVFGPACDLLCFGRVSGASCRCAPNYFGFDCSLYAPPDSTRSFSTTVRAGQGKEGGRERERKRGRGREGELLLSERGRGRGRRNPGPAVPPKVLATD